MTADVVANDVTYDTIQDAMLYMFVLLLFFSGVIFVETSSSEMTVSSSSVFITVLCIDVDVVGFVCLAKTHFEVTLPWLGLFSTVILFYVSKEEMRYSRNIHFTVPDVPGNEC